MLTDFRNQTPSEYDVLNNPKRIILNVLFVSSPAYQNCSDIPTYDHSMWYPCVVMEIFDKQRLSAERYLILIVFTSSNNASTTKEKDCLSWPYDPASNRKGARFLDRITWDGRALLCIYCLNDIRLNSKRTKNKYVYIFGTRVKLDWLMITRCVRPHSTVWPIRFTCTPCLQFLPVPCTWFIQKG